MKRDFLSIGGMPEKVPSMNFDDLFRVMVERMLKSFCDTITKAYPEGGYPIAEYQTEETMGVQIALESDLFTTELFILRRNFNGYEIQILTEGDCYGVFEYEFPEDDPLCKGINKDIQQEFSKALEF